MIRRVAWHARRVAGQLDRRFFLTLAQGLVGVVLVAAILITLFEKPWTFESVFDSFNWGIATVLGQGDSAFVTSPAGRAIGWLLILFGVAMLGMITGALVAMVIDFLLKEGQGLGASGFKDHIVVCGWNTTARDLITELRGDDYQQRVVVIADLDKNPAGDGVYFVRGDATNEADLERAGISEAAAALVFPEDTSDGADMRSILTIMAIEHAAPGVRTVAEVNNPKHEPHFRRAERGRAARPVQDRVTPAGPVRPVPRADRDRHGHRVRRRRLGAVSDRPAGRVLRPVDRRGRRCGCARNTGRRSCRSTGSDTPT